MPAAKTKQKRIGHYTDITGQTFGDLTALYPTNARDSRGSVIWHCRCSCGNTLDVTYNRLRYTNVQSCGCRKRAHNAQLHTHLTHVADTSVDILKSKKIPTDNTTGFRGVYFIRGKYIAKIVFQGKQYYLGAYRDPQDAADARRQAEALLFDGFTEYYDTYSRRAAEDPVWAQENPIEITVNRDRDHALTVSFSPVL